MPLKLKAAKLDILLRNAENSVSGYFILEKYLMEIDLLELVALFEEYPEQMMKLADRRYDNYWLGVLVLLNPEAPYRKPSILTPFEFVYGYLNWLKTDPTAFLRDFKKETSEVLSPKDDMVEKKEEAMPRKEMFIEEEEEEKEEEERVVRKLPLEDEKEKKVIGKLLLDDEEEKEEEERVERKLLLDDEEEKEEEERVERKLLLDDEEEKEEEERVERKLLLDDEEKEVEEKILQSHNIENQVDKPVIQQKEFEKFPYTSFLKRKFHSYYALDLWTIHIFNAFYHEKEKFTLEDLKDQESILFNEAPLHGTPGYLLMALFYFHLCHSKIYSLITEAKDPFEDKKIQDQYYLKTLMFLEIAAKVEKKSQNDINNAFGGSRNAEKIFDLKIKDLKNKCARLISSDWMPNLTKQANEFLKIVDEEIKNIRSKRETIIPAGKINIYGETPLLKASRLNIMKDVKRYIKNVDDTTDVDRYGNNALHLAVLANNIGVVRYLINKNPNLMIARNNQSLRCIDFELSEPMKKVLVDAYINFDKTKPYKKSEKSTSLFFKPPPSLSPSRKELSLDLSTSSSSKEQSLDLSAASSSKKSSFDLGTF